MTLDAARLHQRRIQDGVPPVLLVAVGAFHVHGDTDPLMTHRAPELVGGMGVDAGMVRVWLGQLGEARVFHTEVTGLAAVGALKLRQVSLHDAGLEVDLRRVTAGELDQVLLVLLLVLVVGVGLVLHDLRPEEHENCQAHQQEERPPRPGLQHGDDQRHDDDAKDDSQICTH